MNLIPGLYIVSTPIGNLEDITLRAISVLKNSDIILCEDTRVTNRLLAKHGISKPLTPYNDNSDEKKRQQIRRLINDGKIVALVSDAGTPLISDPGYKLIRNLQDENYHIDVIPGACSAVAALTLSGLATDQFLFAGFLPKTDLAKEKVFKELGKIKATLVFFETAGRLLSSLKVALTVLGDREASVVREITKLYQETKRLKISDLIEYYQSHPAKGEIVLLISREQEVQASIEDMVMEIQELLADGISAKTVTSTIFEKYKGLFSRGEIYKMVNDLKK